MLLFIIFSFFCFSQQLWEEGRPTPVDGLHNPYQLNEHDFALANRQGRIHSLHYPVKITGLLLPYEPIRRVADQEYNNPIREILYKIVSDISKVQSFDDITRWLGLHDYPLYEGEGPYYVPMDFSEKENRMGFTVIEQNNTKGFTFSCAACHSANLFGSRIIGLTNRFPRANSLFVKGKQFFHFVEPKSFSLFTGASAQEVDLIRRTKNNLNYVEAREPSFIGLDTSLAHVAISLSRRARDEYASKRRIHSIFPRYEDLRYYVADSKPGVWWNVKYKNRWLLDGSVVSGNPIITNLLWNEIGRGTDLYQLEDWLEQNQNVIEELTTAVFGAQAPHMTDFFGEEYFDLQKAKLGQQIYNQAQCYKCHGHYQKTWDLDNPSITHWSDIYKTQSVDYPEQTLVKNVGSDPQRWKGMASLKQLNDLAISKKYGIKIKPQEGYVPPPLVGIWARWPYFHNNSIPNLCALFSPSKNRPKSYYAGPAINKDRDFDFNCNGYPLGEKTPKEWKKRQFLYDTKKAGMSNTGHYKKLFLDANGNEIYSKEEKMALIHFLQTL